MERQQNKMPQDPVKDKVKIWRDISNHWNVKINDETYCLKSRAAEIANILHEAVAIGFKAGCENSMSYEGDEKMETQQTEEIEIALDPILARVRVIKKAGRIVRDILEKKIARYVRLEANNQQVKDKPEPHGAIEILTDQLDIIEEIFEDIDRLQSQL